MSGCGVQDDSGTNHIRGRCQIRLLTSQIDVADGADMHDDVTAHDRVRDNINVGQVSDYMPELRSSSWEQVESSNFPS